MDLGGDTLELTCLSNALRLPMPETPKVIAKAKTKGGRQYGYYGHAQCPNKATATRRRRTCENEAVMLRETHATRKGV